MYLRLHRRQAGQMQGQQGRRLRMSSFSIEKSGRARLYGGVRAEREGQSENMPPI
jgi:hypothetical protein